MRITDRELGVKLVDSGRYTMNFMIGDLPERRLRDAMLQHARVVSALMLRDIKTRAGSTYLGFLFGLIVPLAHTGIILAVYILAGRRAAIGTDIALYLSTAILPFVVWSYTHQKVLQCWTQNMALTSFPIVKLWDILVARALTELLNTTLVIVVTAVVLAMTVQDFFISDSPAFLYGLLMAYMLGVSTGYVFGLIGVLAPGFILASFLIIPLYWVTSGTLFIPTALPEQARFALSFFPLTHIVDFGRAAFYPSYTSDFPHLIYVHAVIICNILVGLTMNRFLRSALTRQ